MPNPFVMLVGADKDGTEGTIRRDATGALPVSRMGEACVGDGDAYSIAGTMSVATAKTGGIYITAPDLIGTKATLTTNMSNALADITLLATSVGTWGNAVSITYTDPGENSQPLTVSVDGTDIEVSLATNGSGTITSTGIQVVNAIIASDEASALVTATDEGAGSGVVNAVATAYLTGGKDPNHMRIKGISLRSSYAVTASFMEDYTKTAGDTTSVLAPANRNRELGLGHESSAVVIAGTDTTPDNGAAAVTLATALIPANAPGILLGGEAGTPDYILKPETSYVIAIANASGSTAVVSYEVFWVED